MKTTSRKHTRSVTLNLLMTVLLGSCLGMVSVRAGDVAANNVTVYKDLKVLDGSAISAPTNGLVLYYSFSTNTTPVPDDSGNGHTGTVFGATWVTNGIRGGAYSFTGSPTSVGGTGNVDVATDASLDFGAGAFSYSMWVTYATTRIQLLDRVGDSSPFGIGVGAEVANHLTFWDGVSWQATSLVVPTNSWHHIAVTRSGATVTMYLDGTSVTLTISGGCSSAGNITLGGHRNHLHYILNGMMDEVRIYNRAISAEEVQGLYLYDSNLTAGSSTFETDVTFERGVKHVKALGDLSMGVYTNNP